MGLRLSLCAPRRPPARRSKGPQRRPFDVGAIAYRQGDTSSTDPRARVSPPYIPSDRIEAEGAELPVTARCPSRHSPAAPAQRRDQVTTRHAAANKRRRIKMIVVVGRVRTDEQRREQLTDWTNRTQRVPVERGTLSPLRGPGIANDFVFIEEWESGSAPAAFRHRPRC
jgi:hypothetical protein